MATVDEGSRLFAARNARTDAAIDIIATKLQAHGELLAVVSDRQKQGDLHKTLIGGIIAAMVAGVISYLLHQGH